jgi:hypothetical protein
MVNMTIILGITTHLEFFSQTCFKKENGQMPSKQKAEYLFIIYSTILSVSQDYIASSDGIIVNK